jgi:hypothetical protein
LLAQPALFGECSFGELCSYVWMDSTHLSGRMVEIRDAR